MQAAKGIQGFVQTATRKRGGSSSGALLPVEEQLDNAERRARSGDWDSACGATMVGLYAFCHRLIYGIVPEELKEPGTFKVAARVAARFVRTHFDGDWSVAAEFLKWSWEREKGRHTWGLANGVQRSRLSWRLQFSATMVTDWKVGRFNPNRQRRA